VAFIPRLIHVLAFISLLDVGGEFTFAADASAANGNATTAEESLAISIAIPADADGERAIRYEKPMFQVQVTNKFDREQRIWRDSNSWGYYALSFELTEANGKVTRIEKKPQGFTRNVPSYWTLPPHERRMLEVDFAETTTWSPVPFPQRGGGPVTYTMRAIFEIGETEESKKFNVWTGRIVSKPEKYTFYGGK
jgi:hypothetical protein